MMDSPFEKAAKNFVMPAESCRLLFGHEGLKSRHKHTAQCDVTITQFTHNMTIHTKVVQ
jgi:hypothetical protein